MIRAAIDVGSNSVLTTVERLKDGHWSMVFESSTVTGLGRGSKESGLLAPEPMERTLEAIRTGWNQATSHGATEIRAGGTMALRISQNADEFLNLASRQSTPITVITGEMEAWLGLMSVVLDPFFESEPAITIIDPGGHSTEMSTAVRQSNGKWSVRFQRSFAIGTLAMLSSIFEDECPDPSKQLLACAEIDQTIGLRYLPFKAGCAVTLGATGVNLISIREKLANWTPSLVHGAILDYEEVAKASGWLSSLPLSERSTIVGMEPGRAETLHAGALILERFMFAAGVETCAVSVRGWRHAWLELDFPNQQN